MRNKLYLNLRMFDGGASGGGAGGAAAGGNGGTGAGGTAAAAGSESGNPEGAPEGTPEIEDREAGYKEFKNKYKAEFDRDVQKHINRRYAENQTLHETLDSHNALLELLGNKYGVMAGENGYDVSEITAAIEKDNSFFEEMALREGMPVEKYKEYARMQRENSMLQAAKERHDQMHQREMAYKKWDEESQVCKSHYPQFDFSSEIQNPDFTRLIANGVSVKNAYEVCHQDEIMQGLRQQTEKETTKRVTDHIRAGADRPAEVAAGTQSAGKEVLDIMSMSPQEFWAFRRKVESGEVKLS